jgi:hypothetical protein
MPRRLHPALAATILCALAGCGALPPVYSYERWKLSTEAPVDPIVTLVDARPASDFDPAKYPYGVRVDPKMVSPSPADYLAQEFTRAVRESPNRTRLEPWITGRTITLRHFELVAVRGHVAPRNTPYNPIANPAGPLVDLMVWGVLSGVNANGEFWVDVDLDVDDAHFTTHTTGKMRANPPETAPVVPAADAVRALLGSIDARLVAPPPTPADAASAAQ